MLVPRQVFNLHKVCDTDSSRYALGGVRFSRTKDGAPTAVATDGRRLVAVTWEEDSAAEYPQIPGCDPSPNGGDFAAIVPKAVCQKAPKLAPVTRICPKPILQNVVLDEHATKPLRIAATNLEETEQLQPTGVEGRFPRWTDVFDFHRTAIGHEVATVKLDAEILATAVQTLAAVLGDGSRERVEITLSLANGREEREGEYSCDDRNCGHWWERTEGETCPKCKSAGHPGYDYAGNSRAVLISGQANGRKAAAAVMPIGRQNPYQPDEMLAPAWVPGGQDTPATTSPEAEKIARALEKLADGMQKAVDDKRRPMTQNATPKRVKEYNSRLHDADNLQRTQRALRALAKAHRDGNIPADLAKLRTKKAVAPLVYKGVQSGGGYYDLVPSTEYSDTSDQGKALQGLLDGSLTEDEQKADADREAGDRLRRMEEEVQFLKIDGYHPTPPAIVGRLIEWAQIKVGDKVLEPSAGTGAIADRIREQHPEAELTLCEVAPRLIAILEAKGYGDRLVAGDFLERFSLLDPRNGEGEVSEPMQQFDRVVMNPPFEELQDVEHVRHAFKLLKPGGRLVAIVSAGTKFRGELKAVEFRDWLEGLGADVYELEPKAFPNGIQARMIVVDKPAEQPQATLEESPRTKAVGAISGGAVKQLENAGLKVVSAEDDQPATQSSPRVDSQRRLLKRLDELRNQAIGFGLEEIAEEMRRVYAVYQKEKASDVKSRENLKTTIDRFEQRMDAWAKGRTKTEPKDTGQAATGVEEVKPKQHVAIWHTVNGQRIGRLLRIGDQASYAAGQVGTITTIGAKMAAVKTPDGKAVWLRWDLFAQLQA
ncbi:MAG TPA: class I SAM-dependent methyltransferase [Phycisphaerae bacterium]|nr:class I SAM-dependent methyltransferase [Phycisphaerae bacterium]